MYALIIVIHVIVCFILIAAILLQSGRGGGLSGLFGAGSSQTIFGARASTFLTRATTVAAILFLLTCISLTVFFSRRGRSLLEGAASVTDQLESQPAASDIPEATEEETPATSAAQPELPQE